MEGYLDHLEDVTNHFTHKKVWLRRFFRLDPSFRALEYFTDPNLYERKGRIELERGQVFTADELGDLLFSAKSEKSSKISIENSRRFVFRLTEQVPSKNTVKHHYLCAEVNTKEGETGVSTQLSRQYLQQWITALQRVFQTYDIPSSRDINGLKSKIEQYIDQLHVSAKVQCGRILQGSRREVYEIDVKAWILERELVHINDQEHDIKHPTTSPRASSSPTWQIMEYSCAWSVLRTPGQLKDFDGQLRLVFRDQLKDIVFPESFLNSVQRLLLHSSDTQLAKNAHTFNQYLQGLLCFQGLSTFGSDGSTMLDYFLEMSPNIAKLRQEGAKLRIAKKKIVSWKDRELFQSLYDMSLESIHAAMEKQSQQTLSRRHLSGASSKKVYRHHHHHRRSHHSHNDQEDDEGPPVPEPIHSPIASDRSSIDSVSTYYVSCGRCITLSDKNP
jgi:hypothetical protein